jgi:uncharacterized membrane protein
MKKLYTLLIMLFLLMPISVSAFGIEKYYMDINVESNGDIHVKEAYQLTGDFNGSDRYIDYWVSDKPFDGSVESFMESSVYNSDSVQLIAIKSIPSDSSFNFANLNDYGQLFEYNAFAQPGDSGYYNNLDNPKGITYRIFHPSEGLSKIFYLEYIIKNVVVVHNDVAELNINIFNEKSYESIKLFETYVNLPQDSNQLRAWSHGPLFGEIDILSKKQVRFKIEKINAKTPIDYRILFDKSLVPLATKTTNVDALPIILDIEQKRSDEANEERETLNKAYNSLLVINYVWVAGMFAFVLYIYLKHDKELPSPLKTKYYRDFPANYGPEVVSFLLDKGIETRDLSASLLNLIANKVVSYEEKVKGTFTLIYKNKESKVTEAESKLINWFFNEIGKNNEVTIEDINKASKDYEKFLKNYDDWKSIVKKECQKQNFFEPEKFKFFGVLLPLTGIFLYMLNSSFFDLELMNYIIGIVGLFSLLYVGTVYKRTPKGNTDYNNWIGLKKFLNDFGKFEHRDLPHVELWEKYLVYAMTFGLANKLAKTMSIKFQEMSKQGNINMVDLYYINRLTAINHTVNSGVSRAITTANNTRAAHSRSSSGSGFGGGFSGGGGFGGGGGGVGRF